MVEHWFLPLFVVIVGSGSVLVCSVGIGHAALPGLLSLLFLSQVRLHALAHSLFQLFLLHAIQHLSNLVDLSLTFPQVFLLRFFNILLDILPLLLIIIRLLREDLGVLHMLHRRLVQEFDIDVYVLLLHRV